MSDYSRTHRTNDGITHVVRTEEYEHDSLWAGYIMRYYHYLLCDDTEVSWHLLQQGGVATCLRCAVAPYVACFEEKL